MFGRNLGIGKTTRARFLYVWDMRNPPMTLEDGFYGGVTSNYQGHKFTMSAVNFGYLVLDCQKKIKTWEEVKPGEDSPDFLGCTGYEILQARLAMEMFNFTLGIVVDKEDMVFYDFDNKTRTWIGVRSNVLYNKADYTLSLNLISPANRLLKSSSNFQSHAKVDILSQAPKQLSKVYSLVYPYSAILWPFVLGTVVLMSVAFPFISYMIRVADKRLNRTDAIKEIGVSAWFSWSALVGENMRDESVTPHRLPIRILIGV